MCAPSNSAVDLVASLVHEQIADLKLNASSLFRLNGFMRPPKKLDPQSLMDISLCIFFYLFFVLSGTFFFEMAKLLITHSIFQK